MRKTTILLLGILLLGLTARLGMLFSTSDYFLHEQGELYLITKGIVLNHNFPLISPEVGGVGNFSKGPLFSYFFIIPFIFFHGDPFGGRVLMFLISFLTLPIVYYCMQKMFGVKEALAATFLWSISPFFITFSGNIFSPYVIPLLAMIYFLSLYFILRRNFYFFLLASFCLSLMTHFEIVSAVSLGITFAFITIYFLITKRLSIKIFFLTILFFFLPLISVIVYDLTHHFENMKGILALLTYTSKKAAVIKTYSFSMLFSNRIDTFLWSFLGTFSPQKIISSIVCISIIYIGFLYIKDKTIEHPKKTFLILLLIQPLITFSFLLCYKSNIFSWWIIELSDIYIILLSILSVYAWKKLQMQYGVIVLFSVLFMAFLSRTITLFKTSVRTSSISYIHQLIPLQYIFQEANNHNFHIEVHTTRPSTKDYEYLSWWLATDKYNKKRIEPTYTYVITEKGFPDYAKLLKKVNEKNFVELDKSYIVEKIIHQ